MREKVQGAESLEQLRKILSGEGSRVGTSQQPQLWTRGKGEIVGDT